MQRGGGGVGDGRGGSDVAKFFGCREEGVAAPRLYTAGGGGECGVSGVKVGCRVQRRGTSQCRQRDTCRYIAPPARPVVLPGGVFGESVSALNSMGVGRGGRVGGRGGVTEMVVTGGTDGVTGRYAYSR